MLSLLGLFTMACLCLFVYFFCLYVFSAGFSGLVVSRDVHGNGIPNGTGNPMGMGIKHRIGNGKPPQWEWELRALP